MFVHFDTFPFFFKHFSICFAYRLLVFKICCICSYVFIYFAYLFINIPYTGIVFKDIYFLAIRLGLHPLMSRVKSRISPHSYPLWLCNNPSPKVFINAEPGAIRTGQQREVCRGWHNQEEVTVHGSHFIQEDSPNEIGMAIANWYSSLKESRLRFLLTPKMTSVTTVSYRIRLK